MIAHEFDVPEQWWEQEGMPLAEVIGKGLGKEEKHPDLGVKLSSAAADSTEVSLEKPATVEQKLDRLLAHQDKLVEELQAMGAIIRRFETLLGHLPPETPIPPSQPQRRRGKA